jgi:predicted nuclease with RNAse H fold
MSFHGNLKTEASSTDHLAEATPPPRMSRLTEGHPMRTIGVDLAVADNNTAAVEITWDEHGAAVGPARAGCTDDELLDLLGGLGPGERAGVDCPFGWPVAFSRAVHAHAHHRPWPGRGQERRADYGQMRLRRTDVRVRQVCGRLPLSVSFDKLGATAARWAHLADALDQRGTTVDRSGSGPVLEVYPAASRSMWGLGRKRGMRELLESAPWLRCSDEDQHAYDANEHAFDALIAALTARAATLGLTARPEGEDIAVTQEEGWIHLPEHGSLPRLV